jgi:hypothetical protein
LPNVHHLPYSCFPLGFLSSQIGFWLGYHRCPTAYTR